MPTIGSPTLGPPRIGGQPVAGPGGVASGANINRADIGNSYGASYDPRTGGWTPLQPAHTIQYQNALGQSVTLPSNVDLSNPQSSGALAGLQGAGPSSGSGAAGGYNPSGDMAFAQSQKEFAQANQAKAEDEYRQYGLTQQADKAAADRASSMIAQFNAGLPGGLGGTITPTQLPPHNYSADLKAAQDAAFARSKDLVAQSIQAGQRGIRDTFASRGLSGSGLEGDKLAQSIETGVGQLGDTAREQAIQGLQTAIMGGNQDLTARGQDIEQIGQALNAQVAQRGQNIAAQQALLGLFTPKPYTGLY